MYDRRLNGEVLSFGHAGILYNQSFVMYDRKSDSLWVHVTGAAAHGSHKGDQLEFMASTVTTWKEWKTAHPHTTVLPGYRRGGFMGTYRGLYSPNALGLSVLVQFKAKLYPFHTLKKKTLVEDRFRNREIVVAYATQSNTATAWFRKYKDRLLNFELSTKRDAAGNLMFRDQQSGSFWNILTGRAVQGKLKGAELEKVTYHPILIDRFKAFYPEGQVY
ncbi:MAG: DUF3179 domain-containing protein [Proteobacteria bacterium]|nr:DUF3179 domain-containing protein [Pseudomonadota bacterium]